MAKTIRIGIGTPETPKSTLWSITVKKSDVYVAHRFNYPLAKISLHDSGNCRFATNSENWTKPEDRALFKWRRPNPVFESVVLGPTIVFPPHFIKDLLRLPDKYDKEIHWLKAPTTEQERVVMIIFSIGEVAIDNYLGKANLIPDWSISTPIKNNSRLNADTVRIISWIEKLRDFTKNQIIDVTARTKVHLKKGANPENVFSVVTPIYPGTSEERSRGLSPTFIEIILGKQNVIIGEKKYTEGVKIHIKSLNIIGFILRISGDRMVVCDQDIALDPSISDMGSAINEAIKRINSPLNFYTLSGITENSEDIEILPRT